MGRVPKNTVGIQTNTIPYGCCVLNYNLYDTYICQGAFLSVIHTRDGDLTLRHIVIVVDVVGQQALGYKYKKACLTLVHPLKPGFLHSYNESGPYVNWCVSLYIFEKTTRILFCYELQLFSATNLLCLFWCIAVSWLLLKRSGDEERAGRHFSPSASSIFVSSDKLVSDRDRGPP